jgi:hypothetical protein
MPIAKVYPLLLAKAERKGRTKAELDEVIRWLTGYDMDEVDQTVPYGAFFENPPAMNPRAERSPARCAAWTWPPWRTR